MDAKARSPTKKTKAPYIQYSKRLATGIAAFWCLFRIAALAVLILRPSLASAVQGIIQGADDVMMVNIGFYAGNSVAEKGIVGYFKSRPSSSAQDEDTVSDEESNG
ncbi:MAG: hypothetical protein IJ153_05625 [Clostridia bacterium]|nr:hypothetical protein [Clostridia bacterium]MBQ9211164.1 hypothetical protein [Clostridia bacterium]